MSRNVFCLVLLSFFFCCLSCSSKDNQASISFLRVSVSPATFQEVPADIKISWQLSLRDVSRYRLLIYLSRDQGLDDKDSLIYEGIYGAVGGQVVFSLGDSGFNTLISTPPNRYFLILKAQALNDAGQTLTDREGHPLEAAYACSLVHKAPVRQWTVMIYMDGDNSLSLPLCNDTDCVDSDLFELEQLGSSGDINIVVLCDKLWDPARIYYVRPGELVKLQDLGEINMADPQNLVNFADFVFDVYPAEHYLLVLWDHGWGFLPPRRDLLQDETPIEKWMDVPALGEALRTIKKHLGRPVDIVGFDACLMGMFEVAYELRDTALYLVASENYEQAWGWNYQYALEPLVEQPETSPVDLAQGLVGAFAREYTEEEDATLAAVDLSQILAVRQALDELVLALQNAAQNDPTIYDLLTGDIFQQIQRFDDYPDYVFDTKDSYADLYHLGQLIFNEISSVADQAQALLDTLDQAVLANWASSTSVANAHGLSIWFPNPNIYTLDQWQAYWDHYLALSFAKDCLWPGFLAELWGLSP